MNSEEIDYTDAKMLRVKAEKRLKAMQQKEIIPEREADLQRLVHELQVHQIELEMQNEELRQTYETAENMLRKFTVLFDLSPMGYFTLDTEGVISELNFTAAEILGERRFSLINSNFKLFIAEDSKHVFNDFFRKIFTSNAKESCEVMLGYDNKPLCTVYMEGVVTEENKNCFLSILDTSKFNSKNN